MDNYRPISLLTAISKLFEKVVFSQLDDFFIIITCSMIVNMDFSKRKHSTEYAVMELTEKVFKDIDEQYFNQETGSSWSKR